ncbi:ubiquinol-cytochrome c reductase iron-sulfur subunit [Spirosoma montaniterrae]|uniref:(2Fe-2S)-binding protein n=1 Tax=Spirosoma montaniterrae TaxID=1178516 RepID=A0A1P9WUR6_9BACT|nr:Rieske (2Fe-2S) protein [Spirosoma montaniterrae]AQG79122.1 (2Fe-2S)-binding protein [Spirosoma montaniterrae]
METSPTTIDRQEFFRRVGTGVGAIWLMRCLAGCSSEANGDPAPNGGRNVDFTLNLTEKANEILKTKGGYVVVNDIIVAQTKDGQFVAVSANCTHQNTQLTYRPIENLFYCPLHLSRFDATGRVLNGPAAQALTAYKVTANLGANTVRIFE